MPKVLNLRNGKISGKSAYIGRPTKWGNPYVIGRDGTRTEVVLKYKRWLLKNKTLMNDLHELRGCNLLCWCAPRACHGDVLLELANKERKDEEV